MNGLSYSWKKYHTGIFYMELEIVCTDLTGLKLSSHLQKRAIKVIKGRV